MKFCEVLLGYGSNDNRLNLSNKKLMIVSTIIPVHASGKQAEIK